MVLSLISLYVHIIEAGGMLGNNTEQKSHRLLLLIIIQERRDELEGLDLAIERQQKHLKNMKAEEKQLQYERQAAREELSFMKDHNIRRKRYYSINVNHDKTYESL